MSSVRHHLPTVVLPGLAGLAVATPISGTVRLMTVGLMLTFVVASVLLGRSGARSLAFRFLIVAGVLAPMNALRLSPSVTLADLFLIPSGILAVMARGRRPPEPHPDRHPVRLDVLGALLLIVGGLLGSFFAANLGSSLFAIVRFGLAAVGVPLVFIALAPSRSEVRILAWAFLIGACINSVVGVVTYHPANRGIGLSTHSNHLAIGCLLASGFAVGLFLTSAGRSAFAAATGWAVVTVGILKSGSRAGALGAAILLVTVLFCTGSTRILKWCLIVSVGVVTLLHFNVIPYDEQDAIARLLGKDRSAVEMSDRGRAKLRVEAIEAIKKHPLTGSGFENALGAHNVYLQVWGAAGILGLLGLALLLNASLRGVVEGASRDRWLLGASAGTLSFLVIAVTSNILWDRYLWYSLALVITSRQITVQATRVREAPAWPDHLIVR